ncbi:MAG: GTPase Era [Clostridia bacterium]|nr:GTPase Era [Clostridia bacterium]
MKKTGFIAIVGRPNVGKSTLLNAILGEKVAIVSNKPQTTRNRIVGIHTKGDDQFVFIDTPGIFSPRNALGDYMVNSANTTMQDADAVVLVVEAGRPAGDVEKKVIEYLETADVPAVLAINKVDLSDATKVAETIKEYAAAHDFEGIVPICAKKGEQVDAVLSECSKFLSESEWFFPDDVVTDQPERQIAAEIVREKLLRALDKEVPHGIAVVIEEFTDEKTMLRIRAEIFCEKASHKGIIVGKNGETLKRVGSYARQDMEKIFGIKVYLNLWVKVKENWRDSAHLIGNFGYRDE